MKSRIFLTLSTVLSIGLAQAAAHEEHAQADQAAQRSRENKEFALGVAIGLLGPALAENTDIRFSDGITEGIIRGSLIQEAFWKPTSNEIAFSFFATSTSIAVTDCDCLGKEELNRPEFLRNFALHHILPIGSFLLAEYLSLKEINPITPCVRKGITFGYSLRTIKSMIAIEQPNATDLSFIATGALSMLLFAGKTTFDFWNR